MKQVKRIVAILLCAVMMVTGLPMTARADEEEPGWLPISGREDIEISIDSGAHKIIFEESDEYKELKSYLNSLIESALNDDDHLYYYTDKSHSYCMICGLNSATDGDKEVDKIITHTITIRRKSGESFKHQIDCSCTESGIGNDCPFSREVCDCEYNDDKSCSICGVACDHIWQNEEGNFNNGKCYKCSYKCTHDSLEWKTVSEGDSVKHVKYCKNDECGAVWASHDVTDDSWGDWENKEEDADNHYRKCNYTTEGCTIEDKAAHVAVSTEWEKDETNHYRSCVCRKKLDSAAHLYSSSVSYNATEHWGVCKCGKEGGEKISHNYVGVTPVIIEPATHMKEGKKKTSCNGCDYEKVEPIAKLAEHKYSKVSYNATGHWHECECGVSKNDLANHTLVVNETKEKAPTCGVPGTKVSECSCGYTKTESIPATGKHDYKYQVSGNSHKYICTKCGNEDESKSHLITLQTPGTKLDNSKHRRVCTFEGCDLSKDDDHTFELKTPVVIREATCSQNGLQRVSCDHCIYVKEVSTNTVSHSGGTETVTYVDNDCTKGGKRSYDACKWCKASYEETILPYTSHNIVNGKCTRCEKAEIKLEEGDGKVGSKKYELVDSLSASTKQYIIDHLSDVFTDTEIALLNSGSTLTIYGVAKTYSSDSLSTAKRKAFKEELSEGYAIAQYYDISLYGKVGSHAGKKVQPGTGNYVSVTLPIPSSIKTAKIADNAGFEILHMKEDGTFENLNVDFDEDEKTFSFQTDSFSYFALAYDKDDVKKKATTPVVTLPGIGVGTGTGGGTGTITLPGGIVIPGFGGVNPAYGGTIDPYWGGNGATYGGVTYQWTFQNGKWGYYPVYDNPFADRFIEIFTSHNPWYAYQSVFERFTTIARNLWGMK